LLLEPQRTNLFAFSEQFDQSFWIKSNTTVTPNTTISPDGYQNADTMTTVASASRIIDDTSYGAGTYTGSLYVKRLTGDDNFQFRFVVDGSNQSQNFTVTSEWQRFTFTVTAASELRDLQFRSSGAGTGTFAVWGAQLEAGAYATSYIPTLGASVTRVAETALKTSASSLIGASAGVVYFEGTIEGDGAFTRRLISISDGTTSNFLNVYNPSGTRGLDFVSSVGGAVQVNIISSTSIFQYGQRFKMAFAYAQNDFAFYINGTQIGIDGSGNIPSGLDRIIFGRGDQNSSVFFEGNVSQTLLFKTRLTNAQLAELTA
jgi:hypothetical protein